MCVRLSVASVIACLLVASPALGSDLRGRVHDNTGATVAGARVVVACPNDARSMVTDAAGRFEFTGLPHGRCSVAGSADHFASSLVDVDLPVTGMATTTLVLPVQTLDQSVVVTASGGMRENASDVPAGIAVIGRRELDLRPYQVLPQVLREEAGVAVQQTTAASASPVIRGFTGQGNVYLVDGVRLNTSMWRSGPSQYLAWLPSTNVDRIELIRGPMSVQYGSDALGGAMNVMTARPPFSARGIRFGGDAGLTLGSADSSRGIDGTFTAGSPRAAIAVSASAKSVGALRAGKGEDSHASVTRFLGLPSSILYDRMPSTGYDQSGALVSGQLRTGTTSIASASFRRDSQSGVRRYDRLAGGDGLFRSEITPQRLDFGVLRYERAALPVIGSLRATLSMNRQKDGTIEQARPLATSAIISDVTAVTSLGYQVQGTRRLADNVILYGAEMYNESIDASRGSQVGSTVTAVRPLIPDGTTYRSRGVYAQAASRELRGRVSLRGGVRYNSYNYKTRANSVFAIASEDLTFDAVTFSGAATVALTKSLRASFSAGRGFRAANASDLGSVGVSGGFGFEISPTTARDLGALIGTTDGTNAASTGRAAGGLDPESEFAYEAGLRFASGRIHVSATAFDLELRDAIVRRALIFNNNVVGTVISGRTIVRQDAAGLAFIEGEPRPIGTRVNSSRGRIRGVDLDGSLTLTERWTVRGWYSMANGRDTGAGTYLRRMNPPMGGAMLAWDGPRRLRVEGVMTFARTQTRLITGDLTDARIGGRRTASSIASYFNGTAVDLGLVSGGILQQTGETLAQVQSRLLNGAAFSQLYDDAPGFVAFGARGMYPLHARVMLIVIGENLADRNYRLIGSGVDAPGANVQARLRVRF